MTLRTIYTGPSLPDIEDHVFRQLSEDMSHLPQTVLYLTRQTAPTRPAVRRWEKFAPRSSLWMTSFDDFVATCYERNEYRGRETHVDRALLYRFVELGLEGITDPNNPLYQEDSMPGAGFCTEAESLFTRLEFADLLTPARIQARLKSKGVGEQGNFLGEFVNELESARSQILRDSIVESYRTERMKSLVETDALLDELVPSLEAVVIGGITRLRPLELQLIASIAKTWPTVALLPRVTNSATVEGSDRVVGHVIDDLHGLSPDDPEIVPVDRRADSDGRVVARQLFRDPSQWQGAESGNEIDQIDMIQPETRAEELRHTARAIRSELSGDVTPGSVGVVLVDPESYLNEVSEVLDQYEIPYAVNADYPLSETVLGELIRAITELSRHPRNTQSLLELLAHPLVNTDVRLPGIDYAELSRLANRVASTRLSAFRTYVPDESNEAIQQLLSEIDDIYSAPLSELPAQLERLFTALGVDETLRAWEQQGVSQGHIENSARERLNRVAETIAMTEDVVDANESRPLTRLERGLHSISIQSSIPTTEDRVIICDLADSIHHGFERVFVLGLTDGGFPRNPDRPAFIRSIETADRDFSPTDRKLEARYQFSLLLSSVSRVTLSVPARSRDGDPFIEADVVSELRRVTGLESDTDLRAQTMPGSAEDIQRSINRTVAGEPDSTPLSLINRATAEGSLNQNQAERARKGIELARSRASDSLDEYDGQLSIDTLARIYSRDRREPYSASRIETYAACGFKLYMERVLGIEEPEELTLEPSALDRGRYIHDVLEAYYKELQDSDGEPIALPGDAANREKVLLDVALDNLDSVFGPGRETGFQTEWLRKILSGLGSEKAHQYHVEVDGDLAKGVLSRFLERETNDLGKGVVEPTWFEARVGRPRDDETVLQKEPIVVDTPHGAVPIEGMIDRIDTVPGTTPTQMVVRDYKTGSAPSEPDTITGLSFQLPLYALLAEGVLESVETVAGTYYQVGSPTGVNHRGGKIGSQEFADWAGRDSLSQPLAYWSNKPTFKTHAAFRRFVMETVPTRLGQIANGIGNGAFHPTVLDPEDAGCSYCPYADICDVRSHRRHATIDWLETDSDIEAYIPPIALDVEAEDVLEVE